MKKKFLALVLTLAMVLSLVPATALAVGEGTQDTPANNDVITYQAGTPKENYPDGLTTLNKQAEKISGKDNQYKVTLTVGMSQTKNTVVTSQEAATVLVIDISNSMGCTKEEHKHNELCYNQCTPKSKPEHWKNTKYGSYHKTGYNCWLDIKLNYHYTGEQTLTCTKEEHSYNDNCHTRLTDAKVAACAFVETYAGSVQNAGRNLAIVLFNRDASVALPWTDASTNKANVLNAINNISLGDKSAGSTNLEQGLSKAGDLLGDSSLNDISKDNKNIIALTDGAPTRAYSGYKYIGDGTSGSAQINEATSTTATAVKELANLYTVCFGAENTETYSGGPTVGNFLKNSIASKETGKTYAYNADNASQLNKAFEEISNTITSGLSAGKVHDALPDGVSSSAFNGKTTADWDLNDFQKSTTTSGDTTYYTYIKTYTVTIDPDSVKKELFDKNNYYPLNGTTTLKVKVKENGKDTTKTLNFPIPGAKVSYTVNFDSMGGSAVASQKVNRGETANKPSEPTKADFVFKGWYTDRETTEAYDFGTEVTKNITLYAKWTPNQYQVSYSFVSGTTDKVLPDAVTNQLPAKTEALNGSEVIAPTSFTSVEVKGANDVVIGTWNFERWDHEKQTVNGQNISFEGTWKYTDAKYQVSYSFVSGTTDKVLPDAVTNQLPAKTEALNGSEVIAPTSFTSVEVKGANDVVIGTWNFERWDHEKQTVNGQNISFEGTWKYTDAPAPGEWKFTVNQNFINAKGEKITKSVINKVPDTTNQTLQASIPAEMQKNQSFGNPAQNYLYIATETKYHVNSEEKNATDNLADGAVIDLYYYLDVIGENEKPDMPDSIPDCYQVTINYVTDNTGRGKITGLTKEVKTIKDATGNLVNKGTVKASGSIAEATGSRNYFSNWTDKTGKQVGNSATLEARTIDAKGGDVYIFTANFGRSSGSGSGGSNRPKPPVVEIPDDVPTGLNGKDHYAYVVGYPDGMVYPQKNITRAEVATIFFRLLTDETREANMTKSNGYNDMKDGAWYTCAVSTLSKMGIIKGYEDGSFKPDASISRAEFAAIAARFDPDGDKTPATFSDVSSHWAKDEISIAANHGWIKGYEDGSFKPDQKITRAETMTLVNRVLKRLPETKDDLHKDMKTWPDNQNESAWFYLAVQEATNSHYQKLKKDGTHETWESMRETRDWAALEK